MELSLDSEVVARILQGCTDGNTSECCLVNQVLKLLSSDWEVQVQVRRVFKEVNKCANVLRRIWL